MFQAGETEVVRRLLFVGDSKGICNAVLKVDGFDGEIPCPGKRGKTKVLVRHSTGSAEDATLDNRPEVIHRPCPTCAKKAVGRAIVDGVFILTPGLYWMYRFPEDENLPLAQRQGWRIESRVSEGELDDLEKYPDDVMWNMMIPHEVRSWAKIISRDDWAGGISALRDEWKQAWESSLREGCIVKEESQEATLRTEELARGGDELVKVFTEAVKGGSEVTQVKGLQEGLEVLRVMSPDVHKNLAEIDVMASGTPKAASKTMVRVLKTAVAYAKLRVKARHNLKGSPDPKPMAQDGDSSTGTAGLGSSASTPTATTLRSQVEKQRRDTVEGLLRSMHELGEVERDSVTLEEDSDGDTYYDSPTHSEATRDTVPVSTEPSKSRAQTPASTPAGVGAALTDAPGSTTPGLRDESAMSKMIAATAEASRKHALLDAPAQDLAPPTDKGVKGKGKGNAAESVVTSPVGSDQEMDTDSEEEEREECQAEEVGLAQSRFTLADLADAMKQVEDGTIVDQDAARASMARLWGCLAEALARLIKEADIVLNTTMRRMREQHRRFHLRAQCQGKRYRRHHSRCSHRRNAQCITGWHLPSHAWLLGSPHATPGPRQRGWYCEAPRRPRSALEPFNVCAQSPAAGAGIDSSW